MRDNGPNAGWRHTAETQFNPIFKGADDGFGNLISIWGEPCHWAQWTFFWEGAFGLDVGMSFPTDQII